MDVVWYRSWPEAVPERRAYVHDSLPRLFMRDFDYRTVVEWPVHSPGWFMLEWDIALDSHHRDRFASHALASPDRILVAPYQVWLPAPICVHRVRQRPITEGQEWCETFGLGCVYLPARVLDEWMASPEAGQGRWDDLWFSRWHHSRHGRTRIDWSVQPQHLHGD